MLTKITILLITLFIILGGCTLEWWFGDGRGDWYLDLYGRYGIVKINSSYIALSYKKNPEDTAGSFPIKERYFVKAYQMYEPYICLKGVCLPERTSMNVDLEVMPLSYYLVNGDTDEIIGPVESYEDYVEYCGSLGISITEDWIKPEKGRNNSIDQF